MKLATQEQTERQAKPWAVALLIVIVLLWVFAGISAFVMSLVCFGRSGTTTEHIIGLALAFFFGPFYWIYFFVAKSYCRRS